MRGRRALTGLEHTPTIRQMRPCGAWPSLRPCLPQECEAERRKLEDLHRERDVLLKMRANVRPRRCRPGAGNAAWGAA